MKPQNLSFLIVSTSPQRSYQLRLFIERAFPESTIIEAVSARHALDIMAPRPPATDLIREDIDWTDRSASAVILDIRYRRKETDIRRQIADISRKARVVHVSSLAGFNRSFGSTNAAHSHKSKLRSKFKQLLQPAA